MTTKKAVFTDISPVASERDLSWVRERALELAIDMFKEPFFIKEANTYAIVNLAETFATFVAYGKDAAFPGANVPTPAAS